MPARPRIVEQIERASAEGIARLGLMGVATVHEAYSRTGLMHGIRPIAEGIAVSGSAVTCLNFAGDNLMIHAALDVAQPGDILVVSVTSPSSHGMFGDLLATSCQAKGVRGLVTDAGVRDVATLREMGFAVWSRHISASGAVKSQPGWVNIPVSCGGQVVYPGDTIVADDDGVVVVERADVDSVAALAEERHAREEASRIRLATGVSTLDKGGRRELLDPYMERGVRK